MKSHTQTAGQLDQSMIERFWDAEWIFKDAESNAYAIWPREPQDELIAASIGAVIATRLTVPIVVWRNDEEEN